jgi:hypothetical protein
LGLNGCGLLWDWGHRAALKRDVEGLLEAQGFSGGVRGCAMAGMTRTGACLWEAPARDVDALVKGLAMTEKAPQDDSQRWRGLSRCRRLGWDVRSRAYGVFSGAAAWKLSSGRAFESFLVFVPAEAGPACLQAAYLEP